MPIKSALLSLKIGNRDITAMNTIVWNNSITKSALVQPASNPNKYRGELHYQLDKILDMIIMDQDFVKNNNT